MSIRLTAAVAAAALALGGMVAVATADAVDAGAGDVTATWAPASGGVSVKAPDVPFVVDAPGVPVVTPTPEPTPEPARAPESAPRARQSSPAKKSRQAPAQPAESAVAWSTWVANSGGQGAVDACTGGVTRWHEDVEGKPYLPIHRHCGGTPILSLRVGDRVKVDGVVYRVVDLRDVHKTGTIADLHGMGGEAILQTCYKSGPLMRAVGIAR